MMKLAFNLPTVLRAFDPQTLARGAEYQKRGRVIQVEAAQEGRCLFGLVRGEAKKAYKVEVELAEDGRSFDSTCSCPVAYRCKHAVALLLQGLSRDQAVERHPTRAQSAALSQWLDVLESTVRPAKEEEGSGVEARALCYLLEPRNYVHTAFLGLVCKSARRLKNGTLGQASSYPPANIVHSAPPRYLTRQDVALLRELHARHVLDQTPPDLLIGEGSGDLLLRLLATGRAYWRDPGNPPLRVGGQRVGRLTWRDTIEGDQRLTIEVEPPAAEVLPVTPPCYLDLATGECGPLNVDLPHHLVGVLLGAPPVAASEAEQVAERFAHLPVRLPPPPSLDLHELDPVTPRPCVLIKSVALQDGGERNPHLRPLELPVLSLAFDYGGHRVQAGGREAALSWREGERLMRLPRAREAEVRAEGALLDLGFDPVADLFPIREGAQGLYTLGDEGRLDPWIDILLQRVPEWRAAGWEVEVHPSFPLRHQEVDQWEARVAEGAGEGWFDLDLGVVVQGERVGLIPIIARMLGDPAVMGRLSELGPDDLFPALLPGGRLLGLPAGRVRAIASVLAELGEEGAGKGGMARIERWRAHELAEMRESGAWNWEGPARLQELGERLRSFAGVARVPLPEGFAASLRPYQQAGLDWLQFLREYGFGGVLADDMGLGKTVQTLAHLAVEKLSGRADRPSLVVAPTSLMFNWRREAERFAPMLRLVVLHGPARAADFARLDAFDLVLTTYPLLPRDAEVLKAREWHLLILDEAQQIKNPRAEATRVAKELNARHRLCLTGTPLENHLGELWSIFDFLMPGLLGGEMQFKRLFRTPVERHGDGERAERLRRRVAPFLLRRTKDQVAAELPPKSEIIRTVPLEEEQRDLYESIRYAVQSQVRQAIAEKGVEGSRIDLLDALLKLRQVCCDPRLLKLQAARAVSGSAKLALLLDLLPELIEEGRRVLLFSQFTSMLALIEEALAPTGIPYVKLTGQTRDRATPVQRFQAGEVPLFLISLKAGGTGLNLTAADTVIHYDPWWNPAVEAQATDRAHRIGQTRPVFVYKLLTEGTVEERIHALQASKQSLADAIFGGNVGSLPGTAELEALFEPLG